MSAVIFSQLWNDVIAVAESPGDCSCNFAHVNASLFALSPPLPSGLGMTVLGPPRACVCGSVSVRGAGLRYCTQRMLSGSPWHNHLR